MLRDGHEREVTKRRAVVAPAEALGGLGFRPLVLKSTPVVGSCGVIEFASACTFCVPRNTNPLDGSKPSALTRISPNRRNRSEFSSVASAGFVSATKSGSFDGQRRDERRIDGEVVRLDVTRPAGSPVAGERLLQRKRWRPCAIDLREIAARVAAALGSNPRRAVARSTKRT